MEKEQLNQLVQALSDATVPLFQASGYEKSTQVNSCHGVALIELPPILRALLVADGTVTKLLEAYFWESVCVEVVSQSKASVGDIGAALALSKEAMAVRREVRVLGQNSQQVYAYAFSWLNPAVIPARFLSLLEQGVIGIGALLAQRGFETYREIVQLGMWQPEDEIHTINDQVFRVYRIFLQSKPAMLIAEYFPISVYAP